MQVLPFLLAAAVVLIVLGLAKAQSAWNPLQARWTTRWTSKKTTSKALPLKDLKARPLRVLIATRNASDAARTIRLLRDASAHAHKLMFGVSQFVSDDMSAREKCDVHYALRQFEQVYDVTPRVHVHKSTSTCQTHLWEHGLAHHGSDAPDAAFIFFLHSDAVRVSSNWDELLLATAGTFDALHVAEGPTPSFLVAAKTLHRSMVEFRPVPFYYQCASPRAALVAFHGGGTLVSAKVARALFAEPAVRRLMVPDWAVGLFLSAHLWNLGFRCGVSANVHVETSLHSPPPVAYKPTDVLAVVAPFQRAFLGVAPPELRVPGFAQKGISPLAHNQALEMSLRYGDAERIDNLSLED